MRIVIIDYNMGNVKSVFNAFKSLNANVKVTNSYEDIKNSNGVILPGVGAFKDAVNNLKALRLNDLLKNIIFKGKPFLGICIGLQVLFRTGTEGGKSKGLDIFNGIVKKIPSLKGLKIPHMGWNRIKILKQDSKLLKGIKQNESFYFVHSYHVIPDNNDIISSVAEYGINLVSSIEKNNCFGVQFHPEKSSNFGLLILKNFLNIVFESLKSK